MKTMKKLHKSGKSLCSGSGSSEGRYKVFLRYEDQSAKRKAPRN